MTTVNSGAVSRTLHSVLKAEPRIPPALSSGIGGKRLVRHHTLHPEAARTAAQDLTGGGQGAIRTETLPNGVRMIVAERPQARNVKVQVGIGAGSLQDPPGRLGLAHFLEHLAFEGSPRRPASVQERLRTEWGGQWNAYTDRDSVVYYGIVPGRDAKTATSLLTDMFANPNLSASKMAQEKAAVKNEMLYGSGSLDGELWHIGERLMYGDSDLTNNIIGTRASVDAITRDDLQRFHSQYFTGRNTVALVEGDPARLPLETLRRELGKLEPGARVDNPGLVVKDGAIPGRRMQLVPDPTMGTVNITASLPVSRTAIEELPVPDSLFTGALSNVLHDRLRRRDHLTYGARAYLEKQEASDGFVLHVTTSVAPENQKAAMRDIAATLKDARDGFGAERFRTYKRQQLAQLSMVEPSATTVTDRAEAAFQQSLLSAGVEIPPHTSAAEARAGVDELQKAIGKVTAADFARAGASLIDMSNLKVMAHGPVGDGSQLKAGLRAAGEPTRDTKMNPVDLRLYRDMGIVIPKHESPRGRGLSPDWK